MSYIGHNLTVASRTFFDHPLRMAKESLTPYKMNLPSELKDRIEDAAASNRRSMSGEIITRLEDSFGYWGSFSGDDKNSYITGAAVAMIEVMAGISRGEDRDTLLAALRVMEGMGLTGSAPKNGQADLIERMTENAEGTAKKRD